MSTCVLCKTHEASQLHHISYEPQVTIDICIDCHGWLHSKHGVGRGSHKKRKKSTEVHNEDEDHYGRKPGEVIETKNFHYTIMEKRAYPRGMFVVPLVRSLSTDEELGVNHSPMWIEKSTGRIYCEDKELMIIG